MASGNYGKKNNSEMALWAVCGVLFVVAIALCVVIMVKKGIIGTGKNGDVLGSATATPVAEPTATPEPYIMLNKEGMTIATRFKTPQGYTRVDCEEGSFAEYLRNYPLKEFGAMAEYYSEEQGIFLKSEETSTVGVFEQQDTLNRWQQCADTAIMFYAEWLWDKQAYDQIEFQFTNGFPCNYVKWAEGSRPNSQYNGWNDGVAAKDYSYENFLKYIDLVYQYASTTSLKVQYGKVSFEDLMPGDMIVATTAELKAAAEESGTDLADEISYGHAMIVADVAVNEAGHKVFLLVEGNTPSTEAAVLENPDTSMGVWFSLDENGQFIKSDSGIKWSEDWFITFG